MKIKVNKPHDVEVQRRVVMATNKVQFYIEELIIANKIGAWKIAKVFYDYKKATIAMEKMKCF